MVKAAIKQLPEVFGFLFKNLDEPQSAVIRNTLSKRRVDLNAPEFKDPSISTSTYNVLNQKVNGDFADLPFDVRNQQLDSLLKDQNVIDSIADNITHIESREALGLYRKSTEGVNLLSGAYKHMEEFGDLTAFQTGKDKGVVVRNKRGKGRVDFEKQQGLGIDTTSGRAVDAAKRLVKTEIPVGEVRKLAIKYNQPEEVILDFIRVQTLHKKTLEGIISKINKRIAANPDYYAEKVKASLGHGRAADTFEHSADIASNIELENFFVNVQRSNKAELSDALNTALGRSSNLEEEFLKHIDPALGNFWKGMSKKQRTDLQTLVAAGMNVDEALEQVGFGATKLNA